MLGSGQGLRIAATLLIPPLEVPRPAQSGAACVGKACETTGVHSKQEGSGGLLGWINSPQRNSGLSRMQSKEAAPRLHLLRLSPQAIPAPVHVAWGIWQLLATLGDPDQRWRGGLGANEHKIR